MISEVIKLYEDRNDVTLTTYILQDSPQLLAGGRRPAIIICPGGAYLWGDAVSVAQGDGTAQPFSPSFPTT